MDFWTLFQALPKPSSAAAFTIDTSTSSVRIARSFANHPALIIAMVDDDDSLTPRRLANLTFTPPTEMLVARTDGSVEQARFAVLECIAEDPELGRYFCRVLSAFFVDGDVAASGASMATELERVLDGIAALFRSLRRPGKTTVQGLWAELAIIRWASAPERAISAWHSEVTQLHDFGVGAFRIEIKSTEKKLREHFFRLDQLNSATAGATIIASLMLQRSSHGPSVFELVNDISAQVGHEAAMRLETIVADSLGEAWRDADTDDLRFDLDATKATLRCYRVDDIPQVPQPLPVGVKSVSFSADLSASPDHSLADVRVLAPFYADLLPPEPALRVPA
ncbi:MAG: PD-(D/E)XK motif protein [Gemmatimonadaceae bacterium]|nr:PD-(D/E)XK motif protein [Gemmatimonadaceae bacterium]